MSDSSDTSNISNKSNVSGLSSTSNVSDQAQVVPAAVASKLKEQAPVQTDKKIAGIDIVQADKVAKEEGDEYWENYAREIELEKEILEMGGVEKVESGEVKVPEDLARGMGIRPAINEQSAMSSAVPGFSVRGVALDDSQLTAGLQKPTSTGFRWLVEWFIYQLLKARFLVKKIGGKILREHRG